MISNCTCSHNGQDTLHGKSKRVFNKTADKKTENTYTYRCTVCNTSKTISDKK